jgi:hypothetical protein
MRKLRTAIAVSALLSPCPLLGQSASPFPSTSPLAAAEAHGRVFQTPAEVEQLPRDFLDGRATLVGSAERTCVEVWVRRGEEPVRPGVAIRSGEMIIGGYMGYGVVNGRLKVSWKPLKSSEGMALSVTGQKLGTENEIIHLIRDRATISNAPTHRRPDDLFFPSILEFTSPGKWVVVGTSGAQWGCFVFDIPAW